MLQPPKISAKKIFNGRTSGDFLFFAVTPGGAYTYTPTAQRVTLPKRSFTNGNLPFFDVLNYGNFSVIACNT